MNDTLAFWTLIMVANPVAMWWRAVLAEAGR